MSWSSVTGGAELRDAAPGWIGALGATRASLHAVMKTRTDDTSDVKKTRFRMEDPGGGAGGARRRAKRPRANDQGNFTPQMVTPRNGRRKHSISALILTNHPGLAPILPVCTEFLQGRSLSRHPRHGHRGNESPP